MRRRFNSDAELRALERKVLEGDLSLVRALARAYDRAEGAKPLSVWIVSDTYEGDTDVRSVWLDEKSAKREAARHYIETISHDGKDLDRAWEESDAEDPWDSEGLPPPVTKREILDAWEAGDIDHVLGRAPDYIRRACGRSGVTHSTC